jgi:hypothetical protein
MGEIQMRVAQLEGAIQSLQNLGGLSLEPVPVDEAA